MDAIVSFFFFLFFFPPVFKSFLAPAALPPPVTFWVSRLLSLPLWHQQLGHCCQSTLDLIRWAGWVCQHRLHHTSFAEWGPGIHLQAALAEHPPQNISLCKGKVGWWLSAGHGLSRVFESHLSDLCCLLGSSIHLLWGLKGRFSCRTEKASILLHRTQTPQSSFENRHLLLRLSFPSYLIPIFQRM